MRVWPLTQKCGSGAFTGCYGLWCCLLGTPAPANLRTAVEEMPPLIAAARVYGVSGVLSEDLFGTDKPDLPQPHASKALQRTSQAYGGRWRRILGHLLAIIRTSAVYSAVRPSLIPVNQIRWPPNSVYVLSYRM